MKKLVALIISTSLILVPCFAYADTASGSALTLDEQLWIMSEGGIQPVEIAALEAAEIKAAAADNTNVFLNGYSMPSSMNFYYFGSGSQATTFSNAFSQLPYLAQAITYSIAYSTQNLNSKIQTALNTLNTAVSGISTGVANINTSSGNTATNTSNIYTRLGTINSNIGNLKTYTDGIETSLTNILSAIQNQSFDLGTFIPNFMPDSSYDFTDLSWTTIQRRTVTTDGASSMSGFTSPHMILQLRELLRANNNAAALTYDKLFNYVLGSDYSDANYHVIYAPATGNQVSLYKRSFWVDFRTVSRYLTRGLSLITALDSNSIYHLTSASNTTRVVSDISLGDYIRQLGEELSLSTGRLAYVLANDEEIAARQAAAANTAAAVSNVISSSGSGSAKPTDISGVANLKSSTTDSISSGVSASTIFSQTGSGGHAWDWFSQTIADELSAPSRRSDVRSGVKSSGSDSPMLDAYRHDLEEAIGFKLSW